MRHHHLRIFLEIRGDDHNRDVAVDRVEGQQKIAAHVEIQSSGRQQKLVVGLRAALDDRDIEPVFGIRAVGDRLVISAMLGLGEPVGAEGDLVGRQRGRCEQARSKRQASPKEIHCLIPSRVAVSTLCNLGAIEDVWGRGAKRSNTGLLEAFARCVN
jgi:hypothetical protein